MAGRQKRDPIVSADLGTFFSFPFQLLFKGYLFRTVDIRMIDQLIRYHHDEESDQLQKFSFWQRRRKEQRNRVLSEIERPETQGIDRFG